MWQLLECFLLAAFLLIASYKLFEVVRHIRWIVSFGPRYRKDLEKLASLHPISILSDRAILSLIVTDIVDQVNTAGFRSYPKCGLMGYKEYSTIVTLRNRIGTTSGWQQALSRLKLLAVQAYDFAVLGPLLGVLLIVFGLSYEDNDQYSSPTAFLLTTCAVLFQLILLTISLETTFNYIRLGSYGVVHHDPIRFVRGVGAGIFYREFLTQVSLIGAIIYSSSIAFFTAITVDGDSFGMSDSNYFTALADSVYYAVMSLAISTPLTPSGAVGKLILALVTIQGAVIFAIVLAGLTSLPRETA